MNPPIFKVFYLLFLCTFLACEKEDDTVEMEEIIEQEEEIISPFEQFLGEWHLESRIFDGEEQSFSTEIMTISEDEDLTDNTAIGTYSVSSLQDRPLTFELGQLYKQILIKQGPITMDCTFEFHDEIKMTLDDSSDYGEVFHTWVKQ